MEDFELILKNTFLEEAKQMLQDAERLYLSLAVGSLDSSQVDHIFRIAHNFKGSSGAAGFPELSAFTHEMETLILDLKNGKRQLTAEVVELLLYCNDQLTGAVRLLEQNPRGTADLTAATRHLLERRDASVGTTRAAAEPAASGFFDTAEVIPIKPELAPSATTPPAAAANKAKPDETIRVNLSRIDALLNSVGEIVIVQTVLSQHRDLIPTPLLQRTVGQLQKITKELQGLSMSLRMVPLAATFQKLQRIVRDTSKTLGKDIILNVSGENTEVDKIVCEMISDPLVHLIRNAIDHGIESPAKRQAQGKPAVGTITLNACQRSGKICIEIADDGKGLDAQVLTNKAIERGILAPGTVLAPEEAYKLIFEPGFSTKAEITDVSGRGVGMDVVRTNVQELHGDIKIDTKLGAGTCFSIALPLTLAIAEGMIVHVDEERFVVPIADVQETFNPRESDITRVAGSEEILSLRGTPLPLFRLSDLLNRRSERKSVGASGECIALIVHDAQGRGAAVLVDDVSRKQQVVIKQLGQEIDGLPGVAGSAVLGDGRAALILDIPVQISRHRERHFRPKFDHKKEAA